MKFFLRTSLITLFTFLIISPIYAKDIQSILPEFQAYAEQAMKDWHVPGMAIAIVQDDKTVYAKGFGIKELGNKDKVDTQTIFQIGSITKSFTTALLAILADEHKLNWDDRVINYLPDFVMYDPWVTREFRIEDLPAQWSGLVPHACDSQMLFGFTNNEIIHNLRYIKPITSFRSQYAYQNILLSAAGDVIEKITDEPYNAVLKTKIFAPLGMKNSSYTLASFLSTKNRAWPHRKEGNKVEVFSHDWSYFNMIDVFGPAGGINSNVIDMANWMKLQANEGKFSGKQIISKDNVDFVHRPHIFINKDDITGLNQYYALGWEYHTYAPYPIIMHDGETYGNANTAAFIPQKHIGIIVLTNFTSCEMNHALVLRLFDLYFNKPKKDWNKLFLQQAEKTDQLIEKANQDYKKPVSSRPSLPLDQYVGTYTNKIYGNVTITKENHNLALTIGPNHIKLQLKHWDQNIFSLVWPEFFDSIGRTKVFFYLDANGNPDQMLVELLAADSDGKFKKFE